MSSPVRSYISGWSNAEQSFSNSYENIQQQIAKPTNVSTPTLPEIRPNSKANLEKNEFSKYCFIHDHDKLLFKMVLDDFI